MRSKIKAPTQRERRIIKILVILGLFSIINFFFFFFHPDHRGNALLFGLLSITILYSAFKKLYMWYNYTNMSIPEAPAKSPEFKVDILTTYFPGEPYEMITTTLEAIQKIEYPHKTYLCDEADDQFLKDFCREKGIIHVTRNNRKDAKAGNINNALQKVATGDICVILDPDHIPDPDFLDPILPHFADPNIGFVQIVQSYYNIKESLVARGAAEQTFQFYGPMMMTLNAYGTVNAIGANCVFRRKALDSIGGHAPGLCEDMHTAMLLYSKGWKAVYVPEVLAKGLAPANLTTYFKQQLKWSRGTFDLLLKVYPKVFKKLSTRQKIHFGILPLHYFSGVIYLINFLIPILALFWSTTPWRGNFIEFILALLPLAASALLIRTFVQKWVIEKEERGFHILGGILQINTWWIYILGLTYTLADKKVPYLPTPKQSESDTNFKIVIPNAVVAVLSLIAVIYGLSEDFTPFSILMAGFALFNAGIMIFGVYLSLGSKEKSKYSRIAEVPAERTGSFRHRIRKEVSRLSHSLFTFTRLAALPLLIGVIILALGFKHKKDEMRWEDIVPVYQEKETGKYLGIFHPAEDNGLVDLAEVRALEKAENIEFDIISLYLAWTDKSVEDFPYDLLNEIAAKEAIPMITWEPWGSTLKENSSSPDLQNEKKVMEHIAAGHFDKYIRKFAEHLERYNRPVYLRFAHEFDNPQYPWSFAGNNTPEDFIAAWKRVYRIFAETGAHNVIFVWNPWKAENMEQFFPGDEYVDWIGITLLNYGSQNTDGRSYSFDQLYEPFYWELKKFRRKPVMISEFGSVKAGVDQLGWIKEALTSIKEDYDEISAVVLFDSAFDNNIPYPERFSGDYLDWTLDSLEVFKNSFQQRPEPAWPPVSNVSAHNPENKGLTEDINGVRYKKGLDWQDNYYVPTKEVIVEDFRKMKLAGINTIYFSGGNIFDRNILRYAKESDIRVIYNFKLDDQIDFIRDDQKLQTLRKNILDRVRELKDRENVIGYSINLDQVRKYYEKPLLLYQQRNYLNWLQALLLEIKEIDPETPVSVNLELDHKTGSRLRSLKKVLPADSFGLLVEERDVDLLERTLNAAKEAGVHAFVSSVEPEIMLRKNEAFAGTGTILKNWQDEWFSDHLTYDGLLDFRGRRKLVYKQLQNQWTPHDAKLDPAQIRILKPAIPLLQGELAHYEAVLFRENRWVAASGSDDYYFYWYLVKTDDYGNPLALKEVGNGPELNLEVPSNYKNYDLLLTAEGKEKDFVIRTKTSLHTPLNKE